MQYNVSITRIVNYLFFGSKSVEECRSEETISIPSFPRVDETLWSDLLFGTYSFFRCLLCFSDMAVTDWNSSADNSIIAHKCSQIITSTPIVYIIYIYTL